MFLRSNKAVFAFVVLFTLALCGGSLAALQEETSRDHPSVPRFPGMTMESGTVSAVDILNFPLDGAQAPQADERRKPKRAEGKTWRFTYQLAPGARQPTPPEIVRHYKAQFDANGGKLVYQGPGGSEATLMMPLGAGERWLHLIINNGGQQVMMEIVETATAEPLPPRLLETSHIGCSNCLWRAEVERRGEWKVHLGSVGPRPAEREAVRTKLSEIAEAIHATPLLSPPMGVDAEVQMLQSGFEIGIHMHLLNVKTGERSVFRVESPALHVTLNDPTQAYLRHQVRGAAFDEDGNAIVAEPVVAARFRGVALLDNQVIILSRPSRPLWIPVTRERYLRGIIKTQQKEAVKQEPQHRQQYDMVINAIREELDALSPDERRSIAYVGCACGTLSDLTAPGAKGAMRLVTFNPDYFDRSLPRTAVQLITLRTDEPYNDCELTGVCELDCSVSGVCEQEGRWGLRSVRLWQLVRAIDYGKLRAFLPPE